MAINKKLIHFKTKLKFLEELAKGNILNTSIVFILDTTEIYTHGQLYDGSTFDPTDIEASIQNLLNNKVDKVTGKGLSTNDYTTTEKNKLAGIASGAEVNVQSDWNVTDSKSDAYIKNKPTVDTSLSTTSTNAVLNKAVTAGINAKYTKPSTGIPKSDLASAVQTSLGKADTALQSIPSEYITETELTNKGYATTSAMNTGLSNKVDKVTGKSLSTNDFTTALKTKLEGLNNYDDTELSNAISTLRNDFNTLVNADASEAINTFNEIIAFLEGVKHTENLDSIIASIEQQIAAKQDEITDLATIRSGASAGATAVQPSSLHKVATSGSYNDLNNKPTIPDSLSDLTGDTTHRTVTDAEKATWNAKSNFSGSYNDLSNKPTIPSAVTESTVSGWGFTKNTGTYTKPSTGIPKTDLASAIQTSLGKADTALQSIPSEYITETELTAKGYTTNIGTITGIKMNGASKGTSGVVDLGTVITAHQDISGKLDASVAAATYQPKGNYLQPLTGDGTKYLSNDGTYKEITITSESNVKAVNTTETIDEPLVNTYIKYSLLSLTEDQKNQASTNIGAYRKPNSGIPKTDLSNEVQIALNNATPDSALSSTSTNSVQNKVLYNILKEKANIVTVQNRTENIYEISPNILYIWGVKSSLLITLSQNTNTGVYNEYMFQFESGNVPTTLILPSEVKFINGVLIESNKVYQVSIINNIGVIGGVLNV